MDTFLSTHADLIVSALAMLVGLTASYGNLKIRADILAFKEKLMEQLDKRYVNKDVCELMHSNIHSDIDALKSAVDRGR